MLDGDFLRRFKQTTEAEWRKTSINPTIYGFQFQRGTRWNSGLSDQLIADYENALRVRFPHDLKALLREMNGTDLPTLNVHDFCGEPHCESVGVYSYPRDVEIVKLRIEHISSSRAEIAADLAEQGFELLPESDLMPIYAHRYVVCSSDLDSSVVLSVVVHDADAIVYANSLGEYLEKEFLGISF